MIVRSACLTCLFTLILCVALVDESRSQEFPFNPELPDIGAESYDSAISFPEDVIGHRIGTYHTTPSHTVNYFEVIAEESPRVKIDWHGRSHQGRPLVHAIVTSPENHENLESIRQANILLSESPAEVGEEYFADGKVVIYLGYSVHGNEASGTEAAILTLYHLAAGQGTAINELLDNAVIVIDPLLNPDGRDRFVDWVNENRGGVHTTDPQDREHNSPWPGGRTNHYWFDLNRDWLPAAHPESDGRLKVFHQWRPQVHTDVHEMGGNSTYFFQPGIPSRTHHLTPNENQELTARIADYHADILDSVGSLYFSEEAFDDFYYGKASAYPDANGAVGILFEQASSRALESETDRGLLHYEFTVLNQFLTSISTMQASVDMREDLLRYQHNYYSTAGDFAGDIGVSAYLVDVSGRWARAQAFSGLLAKHRIKSHALAQDVSVDGHEFVASEALVIEASQAQARLLRSIMETPTAFGDSIFYDVSTWNLPYAFNLPFREYRGNASRITGEMVNDAFFQKGEVVGSSEVAYVMPWQGYYAPRAVAKLTRKGFMPRIVREPITIKTNGQTVQIDRGSVMIPLASADYDRSKVADLLDTIAQHDNVVFYGVDSGLTPSGPDLGTGMSASIRKPSIGLLTGSGTSAYNTGEAWHLLSVRMGIPVSLIDVDRLGRIDLERYETIVYSGGTTGTTVNPEPLKEWISGGGALITLSSGTNWAVSQGLADLEQHALDVDSLVADYAYADLSRARGAKRLAGASIMAHIDTTHPVGYGLAEKLPVFRTSSTFFSAPEGPGMTVARYDSSPVLSGYVPDELDGTIEGKMAISVARHGSGKIIMFADNPNFRGYWYGTNMAFLNAVMLNRAF